MSKNLERAKELRQRQTNSERALWYRLRGRRLAGYKFRRQQPIAYYIVDFVCHELRLVIELDGGQHNEESHKRYDERRDSWLRSDGFLVIRFWNNQVLEEMDCVEEVILRYLKERTQGQKSEIEQ